MRSMQCNVEFGYQLNISSGTGLPQGERHLGDADLAVNTMVLPRY
jgi:hypothetical protein